MIRKNQAFLNRVNIVLDMLLVVAAYALSLWAQVRWTAEQAGNPAALSGTALLPSPVYAIFIFVVLSILNFYSTTRTRMLTWKLKIIFLAVTMGVLLASGLLFLFFPGAIIQETLIPFYLMAMLFLMGKYIAMRLIFGWVRRKGYNLKHMLIIGTGKLAFQFIQDTEQEKQLGIEVRGMIGREPAPVAGAETNRLRPWLGDFSRLEEQLTCPDTQEVVIALEPEEYELTPQMIAACEKHGIKYYIIPFYNEIIPTNPVIETIGASKLIDMRANRLENLGWSFLKRVFDLFASALGLIALSPLMMLIAIGVKISSPGHIFFRQTRVGYERKEFKMLKFRSMRQNSEENTAWTRDQDDRRTKFGSFLRKFSLDELPQLLNVLKGEMSLVGPRPELPYFVDQFREMIPLYMVKHQVRPGMTGWAQVNGYRGDTDIARRIELDIWYIDHWSVWLDLRILIRTLLGGAINKEK